jgi:tetratricopeptide (TPR) repeat protein
MSEAGPLIAKSTRGKETERGSAARNRSSALLILVVLSLTFLAYSATLTFDFVYDDRPLILENPIVQSWKDVPRYFTEHYWSSVFPGMAGNYYRPFCLLWVRLNYALFGTQAWAWHLTTLLLHLAATFLVFRLALRLLGNDLAAGIAALIFGVHPVHIEAVAWISGLTEPLFAVPFLLAFLCHLKWREQERRKWLGLALVCQTGAMLAKETAVVFPLLAGVWEWTRVQRQPADAQSWGSVRGVVLALRRTAAYWALLPPYLVARALVLGGFRHLPTDLPFSAVLYTWPSLVWFWIRQLLWPFDLSGFYSLGTVHQPDLPHFVFPALASLAVLGPLLWGAKRSRQVAVALALLALPLLPLLDIRVFAEDDFAHDRFLYLPSVGLALLVGIAAKRIPEGRGRIFGYPTTRVVPAALLGTVLLLSTASQSLFFADNITFFRHAVAHAPQNKFAKANLASHLAEQGRYEEALQHLEQVRAAHPDYWVAAYNLAYTYYRIGRLADAEAQFLKAIQLNPGDSDQYMYLGLTHLNQNRLGEAERAMRHALALRDDKYGYHFALAMVLKLKGDRDGARAEFQKELALHPENSEAAAQLLKLGQRGNDSPAPVASQE